jgi:hypothetical protein
MLVKGLRCCAIEEAKKPFVITINSIRYVMHYGMVH